MATQQQEATAHDDNALVTRQELQGMIRGFHGILNWMATVMERMAQGPENNPLPPRRQEELQRCKAAVGRQNPHPQRRWVEPRPMCDQAGRQNLQFQIRHEDPQPNNTSISGREENHSHVMSTTTSASRSQTHVSRTVSREHPARSRTYASQRSGARRVHALGNQQERTREQFGETKSVFDRLGCNGKQRENLRDRLNARKRARERALVNNQGRLPVKLKIAYLREAVDVLNRREDELATGYRNLITSIFATITGGKAILHTFGALGQHETKG